jgi:hypothetical protein
MTPKIARNPPQVRFNSMGSGKCAAEAARTGESACLTCAAALEKRMQGKTCFNFQNEPEPPLIRDLTMLTEAAFRDWPPGSAPVTRHL